MKAANEAKPAGDATPVIFDTLKAAQELRKTGFEDRQAEAVVETISKAVSETVATKADLQLVRSEMAMNADLQLLRSDVELLRSEMATKADLQLLRSDVELLQQSVDSRFEKMEIKVDALENRIVLKLGGLMVTMIFVLLAIGPFYISWVMSLLGSS
ncbi:MAG: DUF1640 domain-containing protein [Gammaproteobacteria bacterium]|nr:DUF1640 domain-containing protein [Gammaproteobacteria bacterium]